MEKKIRVTLPLEIHNIIETDSEDFGINKNFLCNYLFENYKYIKIINNFDYNLLKNKKIIQFNLSKTNLENYYNFLIENNIQIEAEFFRNLIISYSIKSKKNRELFIFKNILSKIDYAIKNNYQIVLNFRDGNKKLVSPFLVSSSKLEIKNYLFSYEEETKTFKNFLIRNIRSTYILKKNRTFQDEIFIKNVVNNFDPFLSTNNYILVRFSENGLKNLKTLKTNRPKILEKNGFTYKFECSLEKGKRYFAYFLSDAEIIEPFELRNWFKDHFKKGTRLY